MEREEFQSRSGFSGRLDLPPPSVFAKWPSFNPVLGFLVVSTVDFHNSTRIYRDVSIPFWVFWSSRRLCRLCGFTHRPVSIPFWVFWSSRRTSPAVGEVSVNEFQSRSGFSGRLDHVSFLPRTWRRRVSIPFWVFWSSRPTVFENLYNISTVFQSRSGFSGRLDMPVLR